MHKYKIPAIAALFCCALPVCAQPPSCQGAPIPICGMGSPAGGKQVKPMAVPTTAQIVTPYDAYLQTITVTNTTAAAVTFTLADRQSSPIAVLAAVSIAANQTYVITFPDGYWCPNGFTIVASGGGLNWYGAWKQ